MANSRVGVRLNLALAMSGSAGWGFALQQVNLHLL
jgi:hypothetical protein